MIVNGKQAVLRVRYIGDGRWVAVLLDAQDAELELDRSTPGTEDHAERAMECFKRYGAWKPS